MESSTRRLVLLATGILFSLCICSVALSGAIFAGWLPGLDLFSTTGSGSSPTEPPPTFEPQNGSLPADPTAAATADLPGITQEIREQMNEIQEQIVALRGLRPRSRVDRQLLTTEQLRGVVQDDFLADYSQEEAADDSRLFAMLGLVDPGFDFWTLYLDLLSEQIAGFYDDEDKAMFIVQEGGFRGPERVTYAHEYAHALQDQTFDFQKGLGYSHDDCEADSQRCAGIQALIEGDATLAEEQWLRTYATEDDIQSLLDFIDSYESPVFDSTPPFLQQDFLFPYTTGQLFVRALFDSGGWAEVDGAYAELPLSTEQILHPDRYPDDKPVRLELPDLAESLGGGWRELDRDVLGELYVRFVLEQYLGEASAADAAAGWGGDRYVGLHNDESGESALVVVLSWDSIRDTQDFALAFRDYGDARFGERTSTTDTSYTWETGGEVVVLERRSDQTLWILAPDAGAAATLREAIDFPVAKN